MESKAKVIVDRLDDGYPRSEHHDDGKDFFVIGRTQALWFNHREQECFIQPMHNCWLQARDGEAVLAAGDGTYGCFVRREDLERAVTILLECDDDSAISLEVVLNASIKKIIHDEDGWCRSGLARQYPNDGWRICAAEIGVSITEQESDEIVERLETEEWNMQQAAQHLWEIRHHSARSYLRHELVDGNIHEWGELDDECFHGQIDEAADWVDEDFPGFKDRFNAILHSRNRMELERKELHSEGC